VIQKPDERSHNPAMKKTVVVEVVSDLM